MTSRFKWLNTWSRFLFHDNWSYFKMDSVPAKLIPWQPVHALGRQNSLGGIWALQNDKSQAVLDQPASIGLNGFYKRKNKETYNFSFPNLSIAVDKSTARLINNNVLSNEKNVTSQNFIEDLSKQKASYVSASIIPSFEVGRLQFGFVQRNMFASSNNNNDIKIDYRREWGPVVGLSVPLIPEMLHVGVGYKYFKRKVVYGTFVNNNNENKNASEQIKESLVANQGWGLIGSVIYTPSIFWSPVLTLAIRDIGGTVYRSSSGLAPQEIERPNLALAGSLSPDFLKSQYHGVTFVTQVQGLNDNRLKPKSRFGFGVEAHIGQDPTSPLLALRGGHNMWSWTAGATLDLFFFKLELDTFGATDSRNAHRRTAGRVTVDLKG